MKGGFQAGAVILAAGASSRMGRPKMLLPWKGATVLQHLIEQWRRVCARCDEKSAPTDVGGCEDVTVVCAPNSDVAAELERIRFPKGQTIHNPAPERGMFSSIQEAARWNGWRGDVTHIALVLGDQPHLSDDTLNSLLTFAATNDDRISQPIRAGRVRHPVIFPRQIFIQLATAKEETLKNFLDAHGDLRASIEIDDPGLDLDIDTPADYAAALKYVSHP